MKKKLKLVILTILVVSLFTGCTSIFKKDKQEEVKEDYIPVEVEKVFSGEIYNEVSFGGRFSSLKEGAVLPSIPGVVKNIAVKPGDRVRKGDLLFTLENEEIESQASKTKDALSDLKAEQSNLEKMSTENTSMKLPPGVDPAEAEKEMESNKRQLEASKREIDMKVGELEKANKESEAALNKLNVVSPIDGVVSFVNIKEGGFATNNDFAMIVSDLDNIYIEVDITDKFLNKLQTGYEVFIDIPSLSKENIKGVIDSISLSPDPKTGLYPVKVVLNNKGVEGLKIRPGMTGKVKMKIDRKEGVLVLDSDTVVDRDGEKVVYLIKDGKAVERKVEIGLDTGEKVEVVKGLKKGEKVVVKGQDFLSNGSKVKVVRGDEK